MKRIYFTLTLFVASLCSISAQTTKQEMFDTPEKTGGVYYAYPEGDIVPQTPAPKGYKPFYISHYGRHGSRYLISNSDYTWALDLFKAAKEKNALTALGLDTYNRLVEIWKEADGLGGDLSPLGVRQHRGIAERMYKSYPEVFADNVKMSARSTTVVRCVLSMDAFCERLKEFNPKLDITRDASNKYLQYLNHHTKEAIAFRSSNDTWKEEYRKFEESHVNADRLIASLFSDETYVLKKINPKSVMWSLYWIASDMQNMETKISFYDLFDKQELFDLWQCGNYRHYVCDGNSSQNGGLMLENSKPLLRNILDGANEVIAAKGKGATFRFGHDGNVMPLALLLHLDGCYNSVAEPSEFYKTWSDFKVTPMAANMQIVFFQKKGSDDIIVKFLHNEKETKVPPIKSDILPYYHWKDVEAFYNSLLNK